MESKKPLDESGEQDYVGMAMKVSTSGGDLLEYRVVGDYTYLRSDVTELTETMGIPMPPAEELPAEAGAFKKLLEGEWVKFDTKEMEKAGEELAAAPGSGPAEDAAGGGETGGAEPSAEPTLDAKTQKKLLEGLRAVVARDVEFKTAGGEEGTERISATASFRTLITDLFDEIRPLSAELPPGVELPTGSDLKDAPDSKVTADFTLKNGELKEVYVDLAPLTENAKVDKFGLSLKLSPGVTPVAPAGATDLKIDELMGAFSDAMMPTDEELGEGEGDFGSFDVEGLDDSEGAGGAA
ncbi:hypothetical protein ACWGBV_04185 [Streptomyces sp. NPDC055051]